MTTTPDPLAAIMATARLRTRDLRADQHSATVAAELLARLAR